MKNKVAPSLLSANFLKLEEEIKLIEAGGCNIIHIDVMDGHFVPNLTFAFPIINQIKSISSTPLDVHLMVNNPEDYVDRLAESGVDYVSFHQESCNHIHRLIYQIKEKGIRAGIALNPATPVETIFDVLPDIDFVLIMSVNPGFGGQKYLSLVENKIAKLDRIRKAEALSFEVEVDGGVNDIIAKRLKSVGANILVAGSYVFKSENYADAIRSLK